MSDGMSDYWRAKKQRDRDDKAYWALIKFLKKLKVHRDENGIKCTTEEADWTKYGKPAGHIRNAKMLDDNPTAVVVAFPGNKGTANCVKNAKDRLMTVLKVLE